MYIKEVKIKNFRILKDCTIELQEGINALVGENNSGKTAIIDAIKLCLGARSYDIDDRIDDDDFCVKTKDEDIEIQCKFVGLSDNEKGRFMQYLTHEGESGKMQSNLYVNLKISKNKYDHYKGYTKERSTGKGFDSDKINDDVIDSIRATYLKPLRDATRELSSGRYSRISKVLFDLLDVKNIKDDDGSGLEKLQNAIEEGVSLFVGKNDKNECKLKNANEGIGQDYKKFLLKNADNKDSEGNVNIEFSKSLNLKTLLEKFEITPNGIKGKQGLGYDNLLFMAVEIALLKEHESGTLLIEEPEAHLHPQLQLSFYRGLEEIVKKEGNNEGSDKNIQVILSTHSVTFASKIPVERLNIIAQGKAYSLAKEKTKLEDNDYDFLSKFLDATKANLFFAKGVLIVEGDSENILLPSIAKALDCDFAEYGVSVVNVGSKIGDESRYTRVFKRINKDEAIPIKVCQMGDSDKYELESSVNNDENNKNIQYVSLHKTLEYYLMTKSAYFKEKIIEFAKELKPDTQEVQDLQKLDDEQKIYETIFKDKKTSKSEIALRLSMLLDKDKESFKKACSNLGEITNAIKHVTGTN